MLKDKATIKDINGNVLIYGDAEVRLNLQPEPGIEIIFTKEKAYNDFEKWKMSAEFFTLKYFKVKFNNLKKPIDTFVTNLKFSDLNEPRIVFSLFKSIVAVGDDSTDIQYVVFHLFNFKKIREIRKSPEEQITGIENVNLKDDDWIVELKSLPESDTNLKKLYDEGGYGLTHIGKLEKVDNASFSGKDASSMLDALFDFLSFTNGANCVPTCAVGYDSLGNPVWEDWSWPTTRYSQASWFDEYHSKQMENLFPGFMSLCGKDNWKEAFHEVIYWYTNANNPSRGIEAGIILTHTAIERLSFEYSVKERMLIEATGFKNLRASDEFRLLFSSLDIPIGIGDKTPELKTLAQQNDFKWLDAPQAITEVRNSLVHPDHKKKQKIKPAIKETWKLGLWYLELSLLKLCGYTEQYSNRLTAEYIGHVEDVPGKKVEL